MKSWGQNEANALKGQPPTSIPWREWRRAGPCPWPGGWARSASSPPWRPSRGRIFSARRRLRQEQPPRHASTFSRYFLVPYFPPFFEPHFPPFFEPHFPLFFPSIFSRHFFRHTIFPSLIFVVTFALYAAFFIFKWETGPLDLFFILLNTLQIKSVFSAYFDFTPDLLFWQWPSRWQLKTNIFTKFFCLLLFEATFTSFF